MLKFYKMSKLNVRFRIMSIFLINSVYYYYTLHLTKKLQLLFTFEILAKIYNLVRDC